jgi:hypothetical protein
MYSLTEIEDLTSATDAYAEMNAGQEASRLHRLVIPYPPKPFLEFAFAQSAGKRARNGMEMSREGRYVRWLNV